MSEPIEFKKKKTETDMVSVDLPVYKQRYVGSSRGPGSEINAKLWYDEAEDVFRTVTITTGGRIKVETGTKSEPLPDYWLVDDDKSEQNRTDFLEAARKLRSKAEDIIADEVGN